MFKIKRTIGAPEYELWYNKACVGRVYIYAFNNATSASYHHEYRFEGKGRANYKYSSKPSSRFVLNKMIRKFLERQRDVLDWQSNING